MNLQSYLHFLRKSWWIVVVVTLLGVGAAVALNETSTKTYSSSVTFWVSTPSDSAGTSAFQANQYATAKMASYSILLKTDEVAKRVLAADPTIARTSGQIAGEITASSQADTIALTATVVDVSPAQALAISTALSRVFGTLVDSLDNRTTTAGSAATVALRVINGPTAARQVGPRASRNLVLGFGVGLLLGIALALLRGLLDTSIRTLALLREVTGLPALGALYYDPVARRTPMLVGSAVHSVRAEAFRQLRTNLQFVDVGKPVHVLVVTSSLPNEGKSTTAANLAILYAESGRRVLLIEGDMRRGRLAEYLGLENAVGLSDVLAGNADVTDVLQTWNADGLAVLLGGSVPPNPSELLGSANMGALIAQLRTLFDVIVLDTPPLLPVTDGAVAATLADGVLLVVRQGKTSRTQVTASVRALEAVDARVLGAVLSMVRKRSGERKAYGYYGTTDAARPNDKSTDAQPPRADGPGRRIAPVEVSPKTPGIEAEATSAGLHAVRDADPVRSSASEQQS